MNGGYKMELKVGDKVKCPASIGTPSYTGKVVNIEEEVHRTFKGTPYHWIGVYDGIKVSYWSSNRLKKI